MKMPKYVLIGGSAAATGAVEAIREVDPNGTIAVISEECCSQYSRPMISEFVSGKATLGDMMCREDDFWNKNEVATFMGRKAVKIDFQEKHVILDDGSRIEYEKLLMATGGAPFFPRMEGAEKDGVFTFSTISDAERLAKRLENSERVVVIGGGLIGVSITEALVNRGLEVTLVELQDHVLSLLLDAQASVIIEDVMRRAGVMVVTGQSIQRILGKPEKDNQVGGVILTNGSHLACDAIVVAIGVVPRVELVAGTELTVNRGIVVDSFMKTNLKDVYASGDVAETWDFVLNQNHTLPLWPLAVSQGKIAGYNMAGKGAEYQGGTSMSSLKYFEVPVVSIGITNPKDPSKFEILVRHEPERKLYKKILLKDNIIVGVILVNDIEKAGTFLHFMKDRINVKRFKLDLISDGFSLALLPAYMRKNVCLGCIQ